MEPALDDYRRIVAEQPDCDEHFFTATLARYRAGDEAAARTLCGSCLRLALKLAEGEGAGVAVPLSDRIQEANAGLMEAITTFSGVEMDEFLHYAHVRIQQRLALLT